MAADLTGTENTTRNVRWATGVRVRALCQNHKPEAAIWIVKETIEGNVIARENQVRKTGLVVGATGSELPPLNQLVHPTEAGTLLDVNATERIVIVVEIVVMEVVMAFVLLIAKGLVGEKAEVSVEEVSEIVNVILLHEMISPESVQS